MKLKTQRDVSYWQQFLEHLNVQNPILSEHLTEWQNASLSDYADFLWHRFGVSGFCKSRLISSGFIQVFSERCDRRFGHSHDVAMQLSRSPVVLTALHTAPLFHPIALHTVIAACSGRNPPKVVPVLSTDWVPMDNLFNPRGFLLPGREALQSVHLFSKRTKKNIVSSVPSFSIEDVERAKVSAMRLVREGKLSATQFHGFESVVEGYYCDFNVLSEHGYSAQCSLINARMCEAVFPDQKFVFLNVSEIAVDLLVGQLEDQGSIMFRLLFDETIRERVLSGLDGVPGCWNRNKGQGSLLFWQIDNQKMKAFTACDGTVLSNSQCAIEWSPEALIAALKDGAIIPGMTLVFTMLMFSMGVVCVGGMRQIAYSKKMRDVVSAAFKTTSSHDSDLIADHPVEMFMAGMHAVLSDAGLPETITDLLMADKAFDRSRFKGWSIQDAVLAASQDILSLS
ncbi:hypothetical protein [Teredinibacter purpureus]|jgi:hypothetical protein|uniref:hypothetical protein n=1 Tax=Teredinibacter purpureus TaxID=2731756 RepID=UPI0005F7A374|nr:hypothetical protein [Teredinibacter purpureus]